jgi:serine/threonine-protein kinase
MQHLQPNTTLQGGKYKIERVLGRGGFGNTYVGYNTEFEERVAVKEFFMKGVTQRDDNQTTVSVSNSENTNSFLEQKEKFKKEARRIRQLKNEHIVTVHDLFEENGTAYYVMDYVDGENLAERLKRTGRPMTESEVKLILPQILDALKSVHDAGIWHLDLKPANIMLEKGGKVKLIDFGASKQLNAQKGGATTGTAISYTNGYAPREQMEQNYDKFGPWTDIYALGATLYNLLTNKRPPLPTDIDDDESEDKHEALPFPDGVGSLKFLVLQMMKTNRIQRPQNIDAIIFAEQSRKEEAKQVLKQKPIASNTTADDDETTIISDSRTKKQITDSITDDTSKCDSEKLFITSNDDNLAPTEGNNDTKSGGKQIIDYVKQPFGRVLLTFMALAISVCVMIIIVPSLFYILGESTYVQKTQTLELTLGDFVLSDFSSLIQIAYYLFIIISVVYLIPLIMGFRHVNSLLANLLILTCIFSVGKFIYNLIVAEETLLNWILFYGEHLLFIICGLIIINIYNGRIRKLSFVLIVYSVICSLLNLLVYQVGISFDSAIQYGCYDILVWSIDLLQVWGIWWFLSTNKSHVATDTNNFLIGNKENATSVKSIVSMTAVVFGVIFISAYYNYKQNNGYVDNKEYQNDWGVGVYAGNIEDGKPNGQGTVRYNDGSEYKGGFHDGLPNGKGTYKNSKGHIVFEGVYGNGKRARGTHYADDGTVLFKGTYNRDGLRLEGYGKETGKNNDSVTWEYEGEYKKGKWNGKGTMTWSNGHKYEGDWIDGHRTGNGTYTFNEKRNGYGYKYVGGFLNGEYHGKGTWYYVGGGSEKCTYKNGKQL